MWQRTAVAIAFFSLAITAGAMFPVAKREMSVPALYRITRNQAGHEIVKTEQFIVPVGTAIVLPGLEFPDASCRLSRYHQLVLRQVFNSLEEITENTFGDRDEQRVAEYKDMKFEVMAYANTDGQISKAMVAGTYSHACI